MCPNRWTCCCYWMLKTLGDKTEYQTTVVSDRNKIMEDDRVCYVCMVKKNKNSENKYNLCWDVCNLQSSYYLEITIHFILCLTLLRYQLTAETRGLRPPDESLDKSEPLMFSFFLLHTGYFYLLFQLKTLPDETIGEAWRRRGEKKLFLDELVSSHVDIMVDKPWQVEEKCQKPVVWKQLWAPWCDINASSVLVIQSYLIIGYWLKNKAPYWGLFAFKGKRASPCHCQLALII